MKSKEQLAEEYADIHIEKFYYCQFAIETDKEPCGNQCGHCKDYYAPLEQERKEQDLKEWVENKNRNNDKTKER